MYSLIHFVSQFMSTFLMQRHSEYMRHCVCWYSFLRNHSGQQATLRSPTSCFSPAMKKLPLYCYLCFSNAFLAFFVKVYSHMQGPLIFHCIDRFSCWYVFLCISVSRRTCKSSTMVKRINVCSWHYNTKTHDVPVWFPSKRHLAFFHLRLQKARARQTFYKACKKSSTPLPR